MGIFTDRFKSNEPFETTTEITSSQNGTSYTPDEDDIALFEACNKARTDAGLLPLKLDNRIFELAEIRCNEQFIMPGHTRPHDNKRFHTVFLENNVRYRRAGENIVIIRSGDYSEKHAVEIWLNSPSHKENLLNSDWEYTGIFVLISEEGWYYAVQLFAC